MPLPDTSDLLAHYRAFLLDDILPYWERHGLDREHGGFLNCMEDDGRLLSEDKYMWSQGRGLWTFSHVYARYARTDGWREFIDLTRDFLVANGRDAKGDWSNRLSRTGERLDGPISIYSDIFTAIGLVEHYRATGDGSSLAAALDTARRVALRIVQPDFDAVAPFKLKPGYHLQGVLFLTLNMLTPLLEETDDPELAREADRCIGIIREHHMDPERRVNIEMLTPDYGVPDFPQGRDYVPGHGIECAWLFMFEARRREDAALMRDALTILRWHLDDCWDDEYGGFFWWMNIDGEEPFEPNWTAKLWWPHAEALLALMTAWEETGDDYYADWFMRLHDYSFRTFPDPVNGEWRQRLDRKGDPITKTLVLPVKDPFHLPRAVMLTIESLERQLAGTPLRVGS